MRTCTICQHSERSAIETAIANGTPYRHIASQFAVGYKSVDRHAASHIQQAIRQAQAAKEEAQSLNVVQQLKEISAVAQEILQEARGAKEHMTALYAIGQSVVFDP